MKRFVSFIAIAAALFCTPAARTPASAASLLAASWVVTYYLDPTGAQGSQQCVNFFKKSESNGVISGTWKSPTLPGWAGQWVQRGQHYQWHGAYVGPSGPGGPTVVTYDVGDFINGTTTAETSIATLLVTNGVTTTNTTGTATMVQVANCKGQPALRRPLDPARAL